VAIRSLASPVVDVLSCAKLNIWPQALALRLMEEYRVQILQKRVLRRTFGLRRENIKREGKNCVKSRFIIITVH
jgi:hypothetical protein